MEELKCGILLWEELQLFQVSHPYRITTTTTTTTTTIINHHHHFHLSCNFSYSDIALRKRMTMPGSLGCWLRESLATGLVCSSRALCLTSLEFCDLRFDIRWYAPASLMNVDVKIFNKIFSSQIKQYIKKIIYHSHG